MTPHSEQEIKVLVEGAVYQLYKPDVVTVDVVFFHGLQVQKDFSSAWRTTWMTMDGHVLWPQAWLKEDVPGARVLSVCYDSGARSMGQIESLQDLHSIGELLLHYMNLAEVGINNRPVFLVGHSLGGLVIKQICCCASMRLANGQDSSGYYNEFLSNVKGVFYYATPQVGSKLAASMLANFVNAIATVVGYGAAGGPAFKYLKVLSADTARLNDAFGNLRKGHWPTAAVAEKEVTKLIGFLGRTLFSAVVVDEASVNVDLDYPLLAAPSTNHFTVCRPKTRTAPHYLHLVNFIEKELRKAQPLQQAFLPAVMTEDNASAADDNIL